MIDTHCHIQFNGFKDNYEKVVERSKEKGCTMIAVGTQIDTSKKAIEFANKYENVYAIIGLHPIHISSTEVDEEESIFISREEDFDYDAYKEMANNDRVVGIGECGIELFHIPKGYTKEDLVKKQKDGFVQQIKLASELNLPLSIHIRDAYQETLDILCELKDKYSLKGVIHCYTGHWKYAKQFIDIGFHLGFTGIITFPAKKTDPKPTEDLLEVVAKCPIKRMLVETDAPYLAPQKYRGKQCEPWMIEEVLKEIVRIKNMPLDDVIKVIDDNSKKLFNIK